MKKGLFLFVALCACLSLAQAGPRNIVPNHKMMDAELAPVHHNYPASKDQADSILGDVHAYSCYIATVRPIDYDPVSGAAFIVYRDAAGTSVNYMGTTDNGANWTLIPTLNTFTSLRYPSAMADVVDHMPWACWNTGIGVSADKGAYFTYDAAGYNGGLWNTEARVDSLGAGSGTNGMYVATAERGTNGVVHWLHNYWGDHTPEGVLYYRSADYGVNWSVTDPRYPGNLKVYTWNGTSDSNNLFGAGNPVVHDSLTAGYIAQIALWASPTGDTVMMGSCGVDTLGLAGEPITSLRYWYRMSYDAGLTWSPLTWGPDLNYVQWTDPCYDLGIAVDRDGYPHFGGFLYLDTSATAPYGPNSGLYDTYLTAGGWQQTKVHPVDTLGDNIPRFVNYGMDIYGNLLMSFANNSEGALSNMNIFLAMSEDNGLTWADSQKVQVTTDGAGYDYPHLPRHIGGSGSMIPVYYQRGNAAFCSWVPWDALGVEGEPVAKPVRHDFALNRCYPNPVSTHTTISFTLPKAANYSLRLYNITGQQVKDLSGKGTAGLNTVPLSTRDLANGVFFVQLNDGKNVATRKLTVVR